MKKVLLTLLTLMLFSVTSFAQQTAKDSIKDTYRKEFLLNATSFFVGGFEIGFGGVKNNTIARMFLGYYFLESPEFYNSGDFTTTVEYKNMEGLRQEFQFLFLKPTSSQLRYFGGGYAIYKSIKMDVSRLTTNTQGTTISTNYTANANAVSVGVLGGVRSYMIENFFVDFYVGGGITFPVSGENIDDVHLDILNPYKRSINPRAGITFGLAF